MENEKDLRNRLKEFLNRYNDSHEKKEPKNPRNLEEPGINQKIEEIEKDLSTPPKKRPSLNKSTEITIEKSKTPEIKNVAKNENHPKVGKIENQLKVEKSEMLINKKSSWEFVVKSNQKSEEKVKRNVFKQERQKPKNVSDFETNSSGKKPENSHKFKISGYFSS